MPKLAPKTKVLYVCPDTGNILKGYVRQSGAFGADLTVFDPRFKDAKGAIEAASKGEVPFNEDGAKGTFKLDPEPDVKPSAEPDAKDKEITDLKAEIEKLKAWIKKSCEAKAAKAEKPAIPAKAEDSKPVQESKEPAPK